MSSKDYQLLNKLGTGAFGVVYKARDKKNNTICVIKQINISKLENKIRKIALNQAKIMRDINSNYIVKFFAEFIEKSTINIIMEYCSGGDLSTYIKSQMGKPIKQQTIWKFSIQMMVGLRDLHSKKILHRDIKSLNVFLDSEKNIKIGDLGVAKEMKTDFTHTIVGTPYYLSPQMCQQKPYNQKTDIWAMGCLIYELCTGRHPFQAQNQAALALKIVMGKYKDIPNHYSKDLEWVIRSCLSVDHKRRPSASFLLSKQPIIQWANKMKVKIDSQSIPKQQQKIQKINEQQLKQKQKQKVIKVSTQDAFYKKPQIQNKPQVKKFNKTNNSPHRVQRSKSKDQNKKQDIIKINKQSPVQKKTPLVPLPQKKQIQRININNIQNVDQNKIKKMDPVALPKPSRSVDKKQKAKVNQSEPVKKIQTPKSEMRKTNTQFKKQPVNVLQSPKKRGSIGNIANIIPNQVSKYESQHIKDRAEFNRQDLQNMKHFEQIPKDSSSDSQDQKQKNINLKKQQQKKKDEKKSAFIGMVQQQVDDDDLLADFGISSSKKKHLNSINNSQFELKKAKTINWQVQQQSLSKKEKEKQKVAKSHINNTQKNGNSNSPKNIDDIKQLPTIKTSSNMQIDQLQINQGDDDQILQEIDDNRPYHSDQDDQNQQEIKDKVQQQLLIESNQQQQVFLLEKKIIQNQKRKKQLQQLKKLHQNELICKITKQTYERLKERVINGTDQQVQKLLKTTIKQSAGIIKFYKIFQWDLQIQRCDNNIKGINEKIQSIGIKK